MDAPEPHRPRLEVALKVARGQPMPADELEPAACLRERHPGGFEHEAVRVADRQLAVPGRDVEGPDGGEPALPPLVDLDGEGEPAGIEDGDAGLLPDLPDDGLEHKLAGLDA